jgi:hypothetical protein
MANSKRRRAVPNEEFITAWQTSTSLGGVVQKLYKEETTGGDPIRMSLSTRASQLRKLGIPLKVMPRGRRGVSLTPKHLSELAKLALELEKQ